MGAVKRVILIPDGFADEPIPAFGNKTPMQAAATPTLDAIAPTAAQGRSLNVPESLTPGSDVATLALLGYDPLESYTGRAPLEAAAQSIPLGPNDWAFRCNTTTVENGVMIDFSGGHMGNEDAAELMSELNRDVAPRWATEIAPEIGGTIEFYPSVGYRNLTIFRPDPNATGSNATADPNATDPERAVPFDATTKTFPPHDYADKPIAGVLPQGKNAAALRRLMDACAESFAKSPVAARRRAAGKLPATCAWLWGQGTRPKLTPFAEKYGFGPGAMITAVDLLRGIARNLGWDVLDVPGATGYIDTDFAAKGERAARALDEYDVVCVHVEAPDESGHEGSAERKKFSLEQISEKTLPPILAKLRTFENWRLLISPDHPTPVSMKTHSRGLVPWAIFGSDVTGDGFATYDETTGAAAKRFYPRGQGLTSLFLNGDLK